MKKFSFLFLILIYLAASIFTPALAQEQASLFTRNAGYSETGFLFHGGVHGRRIDYYDYATGYSMPLCTRPECNHADPADQLTNYDNILEIMQDTSICYAYRLSIASGGSGAVLMHEGMVYIIDVQPDFFGEKNIVDVYVSQVDGDTALICSLGDQFSWDREVFVNEFLMMGENLIINLTAEKNSLLDKERSDQLGELPPESMLLNVSLKSGEVTRLTSVEPNIRQYYELLGLQNDVLYYYYSYSPENDAEEETAGSLSAQDGFSILGVQVHTGETIVPDERLTEMNNTYGMELTVAWKDRLYALIPPQSEEETDAVFLVYNLTTGVCETEYAFPFDKETEFYPYYALSDGVMLAYDFGAGEYALRHLRTGELIVLDIPGLLFQNDGNGDYRNVYELVTGLYQTKPLIFEHYTADGERVLAYIAAEDLLNGKTEIKDFIGE